MMDAINPTRDDAPEFAKEWDGDECACAQCADTNATLFYRGEPWCWQCYTASLEDDLCRRADLCAADRGVTGHKSDDWRNGFEVGWAERLKQERNNAEVAASSSTPPTDDMALVERAIKLAEWCEDPEQLDDREAGSVIRDLVAAIASREAPPEAQVMVAGLNRAIPAEGDTIDRMRANLWVTPEGRTLMNSGDVRLYWLNEGDVNTAALRALGGSN